MSFHDHDPDGPFLRAGKNPAPRLREVLEAEQLGHGPIPLPFTQPPSRAEPKPGDKRDDGKPRYDLVPFVALHHLVLVLTFGAKKYTPDGWRAVPEWRRRYFAAALRHLIAWFGGERLDPESGLHHLAHAACCLFFLLELDLEKT